MNTNRKTYELKVTAQAPAARFGMRCSTLPTQDELAWIWSMKSGAVQPSGCGSYPPTEITVLPLARFCAIDSSRVRVTPNGRVFTVFQNVGWYGVWASTTRTPLSARWRTVFSKI